MEKELIKFTKWLSSTTHIADPKGLVKMYLNAQSKAENLPISDVSSLFRSNAIDFAKWTQHLDNGSEHYNPYTKEKTESIGFSPYDCMVDRLYTVEELYDRWKILSNDC